MSVVSRNIFIVSESVFPALEIKNTREILNHTYFLHFSFLNKIKRVNLTYFKTYDFAVPLKKKN